jgi:hypothetical protein
MNNAHTKAAVKDTGKDVGIQPYADNAAFSVRVAAFNIVARWNLSSGWVIFGAIKDLLCPYRNIVRSLQLVYLAQRRQCSIFSMAESYRKFAAAYSKSRHTRTRDIVSWQLEVGYIGLLACLNLYLRGIQCVMPFFKPRKMIQLLASCVNLHGMYSRPFDSIADFQVM